MWKSKIGEAAWAKLSAEQQRGIASRDCKIRVKTIQSLGETLRKEICTCPNKQNKSAQGRHKADCPITLDHTKAQSKNGFRLPTAAVAVGDYIAPAAAPPITVPIAPEFEPPIGIRDLVALRSRPLIFIPRNARAAVSLAATIAFGAQSGIKWWMIIAFGKLVLSKRRNVGVAKDVVERAKLFAAFEWEPLLTMARIESKLLEQEEPTHKLEMEAGADAPSRSVYTLPDECPPTEEQQTRHCIDRVRRGEVSRGMASLSASPIAPLTKEVIAELKDKHPAAGNNGITAEQLKKLTSIAPPAEVTPREVMACLRRFPPGSAAGPSGISPSVLLTLMSFPGSSLASVIAPVIHAIISGEVPPAYREVIYGAKLVPLLKKDKALRPIAAGETIRRVGAKILAARFAKKFRMVLVPSGQIGVAVSSGLEALASWCRQSAAVMGEDEVIAKIDCRNAFNSTYRSAMAEAVLANVPEIGRYVAAAYGAPSLLFVGDTTISSEVGAQQGDPLGPVLFSLAALKCTMLPDALRLKLRGCGWYLDDGLLMGPAEDVLNALRHIREKGESIGLQMNVSKTEILGRDRGVWEGESMAEFPGWKELRELELLGLPCSPDPAGLEDYVRKFYARIKARTEAISKVSGTDAHVGYLLLRMCTGFAACVHLARAMGPRSVRGR